MTSWASRYPRVFTTASSRPAAPFMGRPEVLFRQGWEQGWGNVRSHLRSQLFLDQLGPQPNALTMTAVIQSYINDAMAVIQEHARVAIARVVINGAQDAGHSYSVTKARPNPFRLGTRMGQQTQERLDAGNLPRLPDSIFEPYTRYLVAANNLTLELVEGLSADQRNRVHDEIVRAFTQNIPPVKIAQDIADIIGLNDRWATAVENLRARMVANGMSDRIVRKRTQAYSDELVKKRGIMVARTEMMRAMNAGRYEFWRERADRGDFEAGDVVKQLIEAQDCCEDCQVIMDGNAAGTPDEVRGLETAFQTPWGPALYPPWHPHCRGTVNYLIRAQTRNSGNPEEEFPEIDDVELARLLGNM